MAKIDKDTLDKVMAAAGLDEDDQQKMRVANDPPKPAKATRGHGAPQQQRITVPAL